MIGYSLTNLLWEEKATVGIEIMASLNALNKFELPSNVPDLAAIAL